MNPRFVVDRWLIVSIAVSMVFAVAAGVLYSRLTSAERAAEQAEFARQSDTRHARVLGELANREVALQTSAAFFRASSFVTEDEFRLFNDGQLGPARLRAVCFQPSLGRQRLVSPTGVGDELCDHFDVLQPSRIVMGDEPVLLLSEFVEGDQQSGTLTIIASLDSLVSAEVPLAMDEYLVVTNSLANVAATYTFDRENGAVVQTDGLQADQPYRTYDVGVVGGVGFVYVTYPSSEANRRSVAWLLALVVAGLGLMAGVLVANLARTRRIVEREVLARTDELSQFAYRTSHDLSGPLVSVAALCRATREDVEVGYTEDVLPNLTRMETQVERLQRLIQDILDLTQANHDMGVEPTDVGALIRKVVENTHAATTDHEVAVEVSVDSALGDVVLSKARLERVLENLLTNGIKYSDPMRPDSFVKVSAQASSNGFHLAIRDNGLGISAVDQRRLFEMFARFHPKVSSGSGLGLSIVKRHVERMGGTISVSSVEGVGTEFHVTIPN